LRFSPALANKPKGPPRDPSKPHKSFDPFENPPAALKITDLTTSHYLVLNKFAVVPEHFILATTDFKHQTHVLEEADLESTLACIEAYDAAAATTASASAPKAVENGDSSSSRSGNREECGLFAFFNSGEHSGASQPHRHIQLLPISQMRNDLEDQGAWDVMTDKLEVRRPPFATFSESIRPGMSGRDLHETYLRLYRRACRAVAHFKGASDSSPEDPTEAIPSEGEALISYNMAMTKSTLVVSPRLAEGADIVTPEGRTLGSLALNGTVLAGTALVKSELEWEALRKDSVRFMNVLRGIGVPADKIDENFDQVIDG
jgi:ATP adenylyltransferase